MQSKFLNIFLPMFLEIQKNILLFFLKYSALPHEVVRRSNSGDQPEIDVVYLTPQNIDNFLDFIQPPNWKEIKHRRKPFTIFVEGIVGTGKTTFLQSFQVQNYLCYYTYLQ